MKKIVRLTENDLNRIIKRVVESTETESKIDKYIKPYNQFRSIDERLAEMINELHGTYGLGVDNEDEYLKSCSDEGHKVMSLLRKAKEITNKSVKNKYAALEEMSKKGLK